MTGARALRVVAAAVGVAAAGGARAGDAGLRVAVLPVDAPAAVSRSVEAALARAVAPPFAAVAVNAAAVRARLAAAGPGCREELACLCVAAGLQGGMLAVAVRVEAESEPQPSRARGQSERGGTWSADVTLIAPCEGRVVGRRAEIVADVERFVREGTEELLVAVIAPAAGATAAGGRASVGVAPSSAAAALAVQAGPPAASASGDGAVSMPGASVHAPVAAGSATPGSVEREGAPRAQRSVYIPPAPGREAGEATKPVEEQVPW